MSVSELRNLREWSEIIHTGATFTLDGRMNDDEFVLRNQ